ncbi:MAG TPA: HAMP domain-containing sensor histidine kinase [Verrucomicrobiae bacterium]|jgi:signal transduction histidine kinase|nr:HAMP domain-containing sensor histidine kinase [Verrucomicrobiae bacterium]
MPPSAVIHVYGNLLVGSAYLLIFFFVFKNMLLPAGLRSMFSISIVLLFGVITLIFFAQALLAPEWKEPWSETLCLVMSAVPAMIFLLAGTKKNFGFSLADIEASKDRFDKLKEEFLSVASHELRTPLSVINGFGEILVREKLGPLNDEQKRRVRKILMQGQRLNRIIDELLDLSRIRRGKIECRKDVFDLVPVLKACIDDHQIVCEQQKIELRDEIPDVLPDVVGDLERVTQVIVNLVNNSIKYTDPGGTIVLSAAYDQAAQQVKVKIDDTGIGIAPEDQGHVFQEFFRAQHNHGKKYSGSGLGLTIVKQLVEAQGGTVGIFSEGLGKGSSFFFTLPISKSPLHSARKTAA